MVLNSKSDPAFSGFCDFEPQKSDFTKLCQENDIIVLHEALHRLNEAKNKQNEIIFAADNYHWNERGHEVVAEGLKPKIEEILVWIEAGGN